LFRRTLLILLAAVALFAGGLPTETAHGNGTHAKIGGFWHTVWIGGSPASCGPSGQIGYANIQPHVIYGWTWPNGCAFSKVRLTGNLFGTNTVTSSACVYGASIVGAQNQYGNPVNGRHWGNAGSTCSASSYLNLSPVPWHP
jgi:hypothetical protein